MDRAGFEQEAMAWADTVYRVARWMTGDPHQAEDLVQETYLKAFKSYKTYVPGTDCRAWLLRVLRTVAIDQGRRKKLNLVELDTPESEGREPTARTSDSAGLPALVPSAGANGEPATSGWGGPDDWMELLARTTDDRLFSAVQGLAEPLRQAFCLVVLGDCNYREAAEILGCAEGTIKSRMSRACGQLRAVLSPVSAARPESAARGDSSPRPANSARPENSQISGTAQPSESVAPSRAEPPDRSRRMVAVGFGSLSEKE